MEHIKTPIPSWKYDGVPRRNMSHHQRNMVDTARNLLSYLSGGNVIGYTSSILSESEQLSLPKFKPIINSINDFINNKDNQQSHWKLLQVL